jgi:hypothetical protein
MKRAPLWFLVLLLAVIGCDEQPDPQAMEIAQRVAMSARNPTWEKVIVKKAAGSFYELELFYRELPKDYGAVENDTRSLIRALLAEIKKAGENQLKKLISITVWTTRSVTGETGKPLVQNFGYSTYDYLSDSIKYHRP